MKTLVCHGDSLTAPDELDRGSIWPSLVESRLKINVINNGIGGDTSGGLLSRFYPAAAAPRAQRAGLREERLFKPVNNRCFENFERNG
jgi:lysophospholipase L1-like esterase